MRIGMLSPIAWRTPPRHYGPWEWISSVLTEGLVRAGVDVTLFATADSYTSGTLHAVCPRGYEEDRQIDAKVWECLHISEVFEMASEFDIIHNHFDFLPLSYSGLVQTPVVTTIHGFSSERILPVYRKYNRRTFYVSISNASRHPDLDYIATVYHGIPLDPFPFSDKPDNYLLFFGRLDHDKGAHEAIQIAQQVGIPLILAGITPNQEYFRTKVEPYLNDQIRYIGSVGPQDRAKLLGGAVALIHYIHFEEPFGLSVVEALACGTPVIARPLGSMPEIIRDGVNGFLVNTVEQAIEAIGQLGSIDRHRCRAGVEERFTQDRMVRDYIRVYEQILEQRKLEQQHRPIPTPEAQPPAYAIDRDP